MMKIYEQGIKDKELVLLKTENSCTVIEHYKNLHFKPTFGWINVLKMRSCLTLACQAPANFTLHEL